jgi:hypothetical protein
MLKRKRALAHRRQVPRELRRFHQRLAAGEPSVGIGAEIVDRIVVGKLDQPPQRPQQVAHRLVDDHAATFRRFGLAAEIGAHHLFVLRRVELSFHGQVAEIPKRIVHAGIFPVDEPHTLAGVEEILA